MGQDDLELLAQWRAGDRRAGTALFRRYFAQTRRFFRNKVGADDVEDLVQRTFAGLVEAVEGFRGDASFRVYLFAVARRQLYKFLRDNGRRAARHDVDLGVSSIQALGFSPSSIIAAGEHQVLIQQALQRICVEHQTMMELYYWEELPGPEIAEILGISPTTVRTRLHRARKALEDELRTMLASPPRTTAADELDAALRAVGSRL
ncbi:MAG TPA: RNA polymerase sigma factor [Nannocystaceae bacterium]|nr:RNA polymerase sigma factor [Nannocystaceae bacterium]